MAKKRIVYHDWKPNRMWLTGTAIITAGESKTIERIYKRGRYRKKHWSFSEK